MEDPGEYRKLAVKRYPALALRETPEGKFWRRFQSPKVTTQTGAVSHIHFRENRPHHYVVTAGTRVVMHDAKTQEARRTFTRFQDKAYCGRLRDDGKLMVAGGETGVVQVFDCNSRSVLRQLKGHQKPCHVVGFSPDKTHVLSGGDDVTVRWWDVAEGKQVTRLDGHTDYVRAAAHSPVSDTTWITGGYDHAVKLWDVRQREVVLDLQHGAPVEAVAFFPSGSVAVTAGGNQLCVWDLLAGRLLKKLSNHQKTVSCVVVSAMSGPQSSSAPRMLSGSLDGHVKVYELDSFKVTHASKYPAPVLSLGLSPDNSLLAVGMADGTLSTRRHRRPDGSAAALAAKKKSRTHLTAANFRFFIRGQDEKASRKDFVVARQRKAKLAPYDKLLRRFYYRDALDTALATRRPEVVASVLEELAQRRGLSAALGGRDAAGLLPLLTFLIRFISHPRHMRLVIDISNRILDVYASAIGLSQEVDMKLQLLREKVVQELKLQTDLQMLQGMIEPMLAASLRLAQ